MAEPRVRFKKNDGTDYMPWHEVMLGDIAARVTRKNSANETGRPLTIASIEGLVDQRMYFGKTVASKDMSGYFLLKKGEFAYNKSYSVGYDYGSIKRLDKYDMGALSTLYICFALNDCENSDFYDCYFNGLRWYNQMPEICAEGARNHGLLNVSPTDFFKIRLSVPSSKEEQQKIADFIRDVDEIIAASDAEVNNLETQKRTAMKKIFSQQVRFIRADGSSFDDWESVPLSEVLHERNDTSVITEEYPLLSFTIEEGVIDPKDKKTNKRDYLMKDKDTKKFKKTELDDIIYNPSNMKFGAIHRNKLRKGLVSPIYAIFESSESPIYMEYVVSNLDFIKRAQTLLEGTVVKLRTLKPEAFLKMEVLMSKDPEEQRLIADFLSDFDEAIAAAKRELELWKELKKGLLQQMFV